MIFYIDSDGCVFDNMTWKHENAFLPALVEEFRLHEWADAVSESWLRINLYSETRGINRFMAFMACLRELWERDDSRLRERLGNNPNELVAIFSDPALCNVDSLQRTLSSGNASPLIDRALSWSRRVNAILDSSDIIHKPFPAAVKVLEKLADKGEVNVISQAPHEVLVGEWKQANLTQFTTRILGQEFGSKVEQARSVHKEAMSNGLLVGDAPGDAVAARELGCPFHLIRPGDEQASWRNLLQQIA